MQINEGVGFNMDNKLMVIFPIGCLVLLFLTLVYSEAYWGLKSRAVKNQCAQYSPQTGEFEWLDKQAESE